VGNIWFGQIRQNSSPNAATVSNLRVLGNRFFEDFPHRQIVAPNAAKFHPVRLLNTQREGLELKRVGPSLYWIKRAIDAEYLIRRGEL
jgi:hypothetical protein